MNNPFNANLNGRELADFKRYISPTGQEVYFLTYEITEMTPQGLYTTYKETLTYPPLLSSIQPSSPDEIRECNVCHGLFVMQDTVHCDECGVVLCKQDAQFIEENKDRIWLCPDHMGKRKPFIVRLWNSIFGF